jgi:hypothetical protein
MATELELSRWNLPRGILRSAAGKWGNMQQRASGVLFATLVAGLLVEAPAVAQRQKIDVSKLGPQVGERVSDFSLKDQSGKIWTQQSIMGPKGAMLVFIRSADW